MLEFVVALVIFGTVLLGLVPLVIEYSKAITSLENCNPETGRWLLGAGGAVANYVEPDPRNQHPNVWYYVPSSDDWARKLGAHASISTTPPVAPPPFDPPNLIIDDVPVANGYYAEADGQWVPGPTSGYGNGSRVLPPARRGKHALQRHLDLCEGPLRLVRDPGYLARSVRPDESSLGYGSPIFLQPGRRRHLA